MLKISKQLELPDEAVTQTFAILAKRGVGKTYTASVMTEEMLKNNLPVVVIDPIGVWWGLRSAANGKGPGLSIVIIGGDHADVPIQPDNGEIIANLIVDERISAVIDLSRFRKAEQVKFMTSFAETLYHRNRQALHVVVDEADAFAPQKPQKGTERLLGAMEDLVRRGRARGIGLTLITQRPAVLNKNVLTQIEVLVTLRLISPQDRAAIKAWVEVHGDPGQSDELMQSLPSLPIGTAWFWSPGWLDLFRRVEVRKRETLDSSSTPQVGQKAAAGKMASVNLDALKTQLAATIEKVESEDPKILRRKIIELERDLKNRPEPKPQIIEKEIITPELLAQLEQTLKPLMDLLIPLAPQLKHPYVIGFDKAIPGSDRSVVIPPRAEMTKSQPKISQGNDSEVKITGGAQRMLDVLGSRYPMTFTKSQLAALAKMSPRSGTFGTYMSLLRSNELILVEGDQISLTDKGQDHVGDVTSIPQTPEAVIAMWQGNLTGGARRMFDVLIGYYPTGISKNELGEEAGISPNSGTFGTYISILKRNGLIEVNNGEVRASDSLFVAGVR